MNELYKDLDAAAYNKPGEIPRFISGGNGSEKVLARLYFRFMCVVYRLYKTGISEAKLKEIKREFLTDFASCEVLFKSALKSVREQNKLNFALYECNKNSDNCVYCKAVSMVLGNVTTSIETVSDDEAQQIFDFMEYIKNKRTSGE